MPLTDFPLNFKLRALTPELEAQLRSKHDADLEQLIPIVGPVLSLALIAFALRDFLIDPVHAHQTFLIRLSAAAMAALAFWRKPLGWTATMRAGYLHWVYATAIILVAFLLDKGVDYGMADIAASVVLVSLASLQIASFLWIISVPLLLFVLLGARSTPFPEYANGVVSYVFAVCLALVLMQILRFFRQKAFLLELELIHVVRHDSLTGLYNRAYIIELANNEMARARRHQRPFAIAMFDIDRFKQVNDTFGHEIGDMALQVMADTCRANVREIDLLGRIGGEEFVCLLPETSESEALACAERLRQCVEALVIDTPKGPVRFTVSIGVAVLEPGYPDWESLLRDADAALYRAKQEGRNRVLLARRKSTSPLSPHAAGDNAA